MTATCDLHIPHTLTVTTGTTGTTGTTVANNIANGNIALNSIGITGSGSWNEEIKIEESQIININGVKISGKDLGLCIEHLLELTKKAKPEEFI